MDIFFARIVELLQALLPSMAAVCAIGVVVLLALKFKGSIPDSWFKNLMTTIVALAVIYFLSYLTAGLLTEKFAKQQLFEMAQYPPAMIKVKKGGAERRIYGKHRIKVLLESIVSAPHMDKGYYKDSEFIRIYFPNNKRTYSLFRAKNNKDIYCLEWVGYKGRAPHKGQIAFLGWLKLEKVAEFAKEYLK